MELETLRGKTSDSGQESLVFAQYQPDLAYQVGPFGNFIVDPQKRDWPKAPYGI